MKRLLAAVLVVCLTWTPSASGAERSESREVSPEVEVPGKASPAVPAVSATGRESLTVAPAAAFSPSGAANGEGTPEDALNEARAAFQAATRAYEERRYAEALAGFQTAYRRAPLPAFLFNVGQCHRMMNRPAEALNAYRRYLETSTEPPPNIELTRELMAELEAKIAWRKRTELELRARLTEELRPVLQQELEQRYEAELQEKLAASLKEEGARLEVTPLHRRWYFWAGVGAFLVASGASMMVLQDVTRAEASRR